MATFSRPISDLSLGTGSSEDLGAALVSVTVGLAMSPSVDWVEIVVADSMAPEVAVGDDGTVSLGYESDGCELVFTGQVDHVRHSIHGIRTVTLTNGGSVLSKYRINQSYENQTVGQIVGDLASQASVDTDKIEDGLNLSYFVVDDTRGTYSIIHGLAQKSGQVCYFTPEGALCSVVNTTGPPVQSFAYSQDIVALSISQGSPIIHKVTAFGEGAAGSQGNDASTWIVKDPSSITGTAGDGSNNRTISDGGLRSGDAASGAAENCLSLSQVYSEEGTVTVPGAPSVTVGATIEISDVPNSKLNGLCIVNRIEHRYSKKDGFVSHITFWKMGEGGLGGLL